jgi:hypothetical protein
MYIYVYSTYSGDEEKTYIFGWLLKAGAAGYCCGGNELCQLLHKQINLLKGQKYRQTDRYTPGSV